MLCHILDEKHRRKINLNYRENYDDLNVQARY